MSNKHGRTVAVAGAVVLVIALAGFVVMSRNHSNEAPPSEVPDAAAAPGSLITMRWTLGVWFGTGGVQASTLTLAQTTSKDVVFSVRQTRRTVDQPTDPGHVAAVDFDLGHGLHVCLRIFAVGEIFDQGAIHVRGELQGNWIAPRKKGTAEAERAKQPVSSTFDVLTPGVGIELWDSVDIDGTVEVEHPKGLKYADANVMYQAYQRVELIGVGDHVPGATEPLVFGPMPKSCAEKYGLVSLDGPEVLTDPKPIEGE